MVDGPESFMQTQTPRMFPHNLGQADKAAIEVYLEELGSACGLGHLIHSLLLATAVYAIEHRL